MKKKQLAALRYSACILACMVAPVYAANWTTTAGVAPAITYTDNVCLSADNEKGEWIGLLTPDVSIEGNGNRANVRLFGAVEMNTLSDGKLENLGCNGTYGDREQFSPRLNADADAVLVKDWLSIDVDASVDQNEVTPFVSGGGDSLNRTGNTNTTYYYTVSPYINRRFKNTAEFYLRYSWNDQYNTTDVVDDSSEQKIEFKLGDKQLGASAFTWELQGDYSKVKYSDELDLPPDLGVIDRGSDNNELKSAQLNLTYQFNRFWQVNGFYGDEWNDFVSSDDDIDGEFWDVGIRWTPTSRTTIEAGDGHRFYGDSPRFSIRHSHKRSVFSATYNRQLTFDRDIRTLSGDFPSGNEPGLPSASTTLTNSPILDERFTLTYAYQGRRSNIRVNASQSEQTQAQNGRDSTFKGFSIFVDRRLSRQLTINGDFSWGEEDPRGSRSDLITKSENWLLRLGAARQIGQNINLFFDYEYTDRQSDNAIDEYTENRFTLTLRLSI